jgi:hypothetical protein
VPAAHDAFVPTVEANEVREKGTPVVDHCDRTSPYEAVKRAREAPVAACVPFERLTIDILRTIVVETKDEGI